MSRNLAILVGALAVVLTAACGGGGGGASDDLVAQGHSEFKKTCR